MVNQGGTPATAWEISRTVTQRKNKGGKPVGLGKCWRQGTTDGKR